MEGVKIDPNFVQHFVRNVWLHAQEKQYFEERKKYNLKLSCVYFLR